MNFVFKVNIPYLYVCTAVAVFIYVQFIGFNFFPSASDGRDVSDTGGGNAIRQLMFIALFIFSICLLSLSKLTKIKFFLKNRLLLLISFWFLISFIWSDQPAITIRRATLFFIVCFIPITLCFLMGFNNFIKVNAKILAFFIVVSIFSCFFISDAIHNGEVLDVALNGAWRGLFGHKNNAAIVAAMSGFIFLYQYLEEKNKVWLFLFFCALFFLFFTKSKTTMSLFIPVILLSWFLSNHRSIKYFWYLIFLLSLIVPLSLLLGFQELNTYLFDNPELFTGRAIIWQVVLEAIADNPIIGLGYGAVWSAGEFSAITEYGINTSAWVSGISHGHNGYLDILLATGVLGLILFTLLLFKTFKKITSEVNNSNNQKFLCLSIIFFLIIHNFLESSFTVYYSHGWYFFLLVYCLKFKKASM